MVCRNAGSAGSMRSAMLFTHRGFSGPAVLDLSHHITRGMTRGQEGQLPVLTANWAGKPRTAWEDLLQPRGPENVNSALHRGGLPSRLADALCRCARVDFCRANSSKGRSWMSCSFNIRAYYSCTGLGYAIGTKTGECSVTLLSISITACRLLCLCSTQTQQPLINSIRAVAAMLRFHALLWAAGSCSWRARGWHS